MQSFLEYLTEAGGTKTPTLKSLATTISAAVNHHLTLPYQERIANSKKAAQEVGQHVGFNKAGKPLPLLGQNAKLMKASASGKGKEPLILPNGMGVETVGLSLSPAYEEGTFKTCPNSLACREECLGVTSGNYFRLGGGTDLKALKGPRLFAFNRTQAMLRAPASFGVRLNDEIEVAKRTAMYNGDQLGVRLNVLSDLHPSVHEAIIKAHPEVMFYDYTKNNTNPIAVNHHYTYSSTGVTQPKGVNGLTEGVFNPNQNWAKMRRRLLQGDNVSMVFSHKEHLPSEVRDLQTGHVFRVVDGIEHDYRPLDKVESGNGVIVGLKNLSATAKMNTAHKTSNGFIVHFNPQEMKTGKGTFERDENGRTIPTVTHVDIAKQD